MAGKSEFQRRLETIEELIGRIEGAADPAVRAATRELVELVMELHGAGFERMLDMLRAGGAEGLEWIDRFGRDELTSNLLVLHGLHPKSVEARVEQAIERVRPSLKKRDGSVEIVSMEDGQLRLRLIANGNAPALKKIVEDAVFQAAPDIVSIAIDGAEDGSGFVKLDALVATAAKESV